MKRTMTVFLSLVLILTMVVSACGTTNTAKKEAQLTKATSKSKEPAKTNKIDPQSIKGQVEIVVPAGDYLDFMKTQIKPYFEKEYPNATLKVSAEGGTDKFQARIAAGDFPDVYVGVFGYQPAK